MASKEDKPPPSSPNEPGADTDSDGEFDPTAEEMVNDFDDEHTMAEEEALGEENDAAEEIDVLNREGDMSIEELRKLYNLPSDYQLSNEEAEEEEEEEEEESPMNEEGEELVDSTSDNKTKAKVSATASSSSRASTSQAQATNRQQQPSSSSNRANATPSSSSQQRTLVTANSSAGGSRYLNRPNTSTGGRSSVLDDSGDESDVEVEHDGWRRTISVGLNFQATVPEGLLPYSQEQLEREYATLLWRPLPEFTMEDINSYLLEYAKVSLGEDVFNYEDIVLPPGSHIKDDEQALYLLHCCNYNQELALQHHINGTEPVAPISEMMTPWTEAECRAFEEGLRDNGKDFFAIKHQRIDTRTVGEVIQFYYFWKKTERYDIFQANAKAEAKKRLTPGVTDYMDRIQEEQEMYANLVNPLTLMAANGPPTYLNSVSSSTSSSISNHQTGSGRQSSSSHHQLSSSSSSGQSILSNHNVHHTQHHHHHHSRGTTISVNASGEPQTILINDTGSSGNFGGAGEPNRSSNQSNKQPPIVVMSRSQHSYSSSNHHHNHRQRASNSSPTTTIVVGKDPVLIDGTWVTSSSSMPSPSSFPSSLSTTTTTTSSSSSTATASSSSTSSQVLTETPSISIYKLQ